jgi:hypothetical protein
MGGTRELHADLEVTGSAPRGEPSRVLTELGADADAGLIVVGSRGRGVFASLLLGSVSHALVGIATCAVAVVGEHTRSAGDEPAGGSREAHGTSAGTASMSAPVS